jgi:tetratricopeptide (TPR) repeat protein
MSGDTYSNADVIRYSNEKFVNIHLNADTMRDLAKKFGLRMTPSTFLLDLDVEIAAKIEGYVVPKDYLPQVKRVQAKFEKLVAAMDAAKSGTPKAERELADAYRLADKFAKAEAIYKKLMEPLSARKDLTDAERLERAQIRVGMMDLAMRSPTGDRNSIPDHIKTIKEEDPNNKFESLDDAYAAEVLMLMGKKEHEKALETAKAGYAKCPKSDKSDALLYLIGLEYLQQKKKDEATQAFKELAEKFPTTEMGEMGRQALEALK